MKILLVNDDGIHSPGLRAMALALRKLGDVQIVAPLVEQSGVSHRITYLHPILVREIQEHGEHYGWAVDGSPADCTKMGVLEYCDPKPDLIVSGINSGANVGINVLYSGTVAAAIEGAFFGITSIAVSQAQGTPPDYDATAAMAVQLIPQMLEAAPQPGSLWNLNFPDTSNEGPQGVKVVGMGIKRHRETIEKRTDPRGRSYFWSGIDPIKNHHMEAGTDIEALTEGFITATPLHFDLSESSIIERLADYEWDVTSRVG